jgi:hypothetical protein
VFHLWNGDLLVESLVRVSMAVVGHVVLQNSLQMTFAEDQYMIEAPSTDTAPTAASESATSGA